MHVCVCISILITSVYHYSCVEQHEAAMADLNIKLKNTEEKLQTANNCENNQMLH